MLNKDDSFEQQKHMFRPMDKFIITILCSKVWLFWNYAIVQGVDVGLIILIYIILLTLYMFLSLLVYHGRVQSG